MARLDSRRELLTACGAVFAAALSGCSERTEETTVTVRTTDEDLSVRTTETSDPTVGETPKERLNLSEWHADDHWRFSVTELALSATVQTDGGETYELPPDEQLLVVTTRVANDGTDLDEYLAGRFVALVGGEAFSEQYRIENPEAGWRIRANQLRRVEYPGQWTAEGLAVESGETAAAWSAFVVPRSAERGDVAIGYNPDREADSPFPVWWVPEAEN